MRVQLLGILALFILAGCGGSVMTGSGPGSGGGGGTTGTGTGGGSGSGKCTQTHDYASIQITSMDGSAIGCGHIPAADGGALPSLSGSIQGSVEQVTSSSFKVNTCPPNANCVQLYTVKVDAPGLAVTLPAGAFVQVDYKFSDALYACSESLEVQSLGSWSGLANPAGLGDFKLLSVVEAAWLPGGTSIGSYKVDSVALGCDADAGAGCGGPKPDEYALEFSPLKAPAKSVRVHMGQTKAVDLGAPGPCRARDLRSYQTANCDDYWNFAWYVDCQPATM